MRFCAGWDRSGPSGLEAVVSSSGPAVGDRPGRRVRRSRGVVSALPVAVLLILLLAQPAHAAVAVTRAEVSGSNLRLEGTAIAGRDIVVDGVVMGRSDSGGRFRIDRSGYAPPTDCTVDVRDGSATVTSARLSGCTATAQPLPPPGDTTAPTAPGNLTASLVGSTANLSWAASTDDVGVTGYRIARNGVVVTTVLNTFYNDTDRPVGTYTYTVAAIDGAGNVSASSSSASVTVQPAPATDTTAPSVPADLAATVVGTTVSISWGLSTDDTAVTGYRLTRDGTVLSTTNDTSYLDTGRTAGTYTYTVAASDGAGNVSAASSISATVLPAEGLTFLTPARLPDATVGQAYLGYIVSSDPPGPSSFTFKLVSGKVPDGTRFSGNTLENRPEARVTGTPSRIGTFSFTIEVRDNTGVTARRTFTITVLPAS